MENGERRKERQIHVEGLKVGEGVKRARELEQEERLIELEVGERARRARELNI